jgi:hypothetical protein
MFPQIILDINRVNIDRKQEHFLLNETRPTDMILFDRSQALRMVQQYSEFHLNFENINLFDEIQKERIKFAEMFKKPVDRVILEKNKISKKNDWVSNYFYPLNISHLCQSKHILALLKKRKKTFKPNIELFK